MTKQRYPHGSDEDLEIIRLNECEAADGSLRTTRFQGLWNEIERLRALLEETHTIFDVEHHREIGPKVRAAIGIADEPSGEWFCPDSVKGHAGDPCPRCGTGPCLAIGRPPMRTGEQR